MILWYALRAAVAGLLGEQTRREHHRPHCPALVTIIHPHTHEEARSS